MTVLTRNSSTATANRLRGWTRSARWGLLVDLACRAGYVARGFVYVSIGVIALLAVAGRTPSAHGAQGALVEAWADWPAGRVLLWLTGLGLYGFAGWRALQSLFDADRQGTSAKAMASRAGQAISGLIYGGLAISVFGLLDTFEDFSEADDQQGAREATAAALAMPYGEWLVLTAGVFVVGVGLGNMVQAVFGDFRKHLDCERRTGRIAAALGRAGYLARGVAFLPLGAYITSAGLHSRAGDAKGLGGALEAMRDQPMGDLALGLTACGLVAFGLYAFVEARFRTMRAAEVVDEKMQARSASL